MYVCMYVFLHCQAREKFVSLKKNTRGDVVAALEEVMLRFYYVMTNLLNPFLNKCLHLVMTLLVDLFLDLFCV